jgi:methyl-accepting chemotaxis protein
MGYTLEEVQGKPHRMFVETTYAQSNEYRNFWESLRAGEAQLGEVKRLDKHGKEVWLSASYTPILDNEGKPYKIIKFAQDISKVKKESLDVQCRLQAINRAYGVIEFDLQGNILQANDNFLQVIGYSSDEIVGRHHQMFVTAEEAASEAYKNFWKTLEKGEFVAGEFKRIGKNGKVIWLKATYNGIMDTNGKPYKVVKYAEDITEMKLLELESKRLNKK